jgi:hypothetical protein
MLPAVRHYLPGNAAISIRQIANHAGLAHGYLQAFSCQRNHLSGHRHPYLFPITVTRLVRASPLPSGTQ